MTPRQWAREHPAVAALIAGLLLALLLEAVLLSYLASVRRQAGRYDAPRLAEMEAIARRVAELQALRDAGGAKFLSTNTKFSAEAVDKIASSQKIAERISSSNVKEEKHAGRGIEQVIVMSLKGVTAQELISFLQGVEALDPAVRARKLAITANGEKPLLLNAAIEISAYEAASAATN